ncbi:MAG: hypothetical protein AAF628_14670 [Planctomycetota bacterium]
MGVAQESEVRIALLRRVDGLFALSVARDASGDAPVYRERLQSLPGHGPGGAEAAPLLAAWQALAAVREVRIDVLEAVRRVLRDTVADPEGERPTLERLQIAPPPPPHVPTAANPRAYQGTKDRPPKPRRPQPMDLRPFLCVAGGQDRLIERLTNALGPVDLPAEARDVPPGFRRGLAWLARRDPDRFANPVALHHRLGLERDLPLRRAVAWFAASASGRLGWLEVLCRITPSRRLALLDLVARAADPRVQPARVAEHIAAIDAGCDDDNFEPRMRYALLVAAAGCDLDAARSSFELADEHEPHWDFGAYCHDERYGVPTGSTELAQIRSFVARYYREPAGDNPGRDVMRLWTACSMDLCLADELERVVGLELQPEAARSLGRTWVAALLDDDPAVIGWDDHLVALRAFHDAVAAVPLQMKASELLREVVWQDLVDDLDFAADLVRKLCLPPFAAESWLELPLERLGRLSASGRAALLATPPRSWLVLEEACARRNDAWLIACGFYGWLEEAQATFLAAFASHPRALCRAARTLGLFALPQRRRLVRDVTSSPVAADVETLSGPELVRLFEQHGPRAATSPIPKKLRQHARGELALSDHQLQRAVAVVRAAWPGVLCDLVLERSLQHMARTLGTADADLTSLNDQMLHALRLQTRLEDNRRSLRRLIRACFAGDATFVREHPANQQWLRQHAALDVARWLDGICLTRTLAGHGTVTLALEQDPLEVLRLGTYVGSCLGLGGQFAASAAAIALDVNKHVVFARDAEGRFLARQVLAITQDDKLACYRVYPDPGDALRALFADYDRAFAAALGVPIEIDDAGDKVALPLASDWWDDGVWDLDEHGRRDRRAPRGAGP